MNAQSPIIVRKIGQTPAIFLLSDLNLNNDTVKMWDGSSDEPKTVPLYVYRSSTKPRDEEIDRWAALYQQRFAPRGVQVRSRIAKDLNKAYAEHQQRASQPEKAPEQPHESPLVASPENKAQQRRESSVEEMLKPRLTLEEWEKRVLVEKLINAATTAFAASMKSVMTEVLKA